jgi:hypothetical protein
MERDAIMKGNLKHHHATPGSGTRSMRMRDHSFALRLLIASRKFLFHPIGPQPAEAPGSEGVRCVR